MPLVDQGLLMLPKHMSCAFDIPDIKFKMYLNLKIMLFFFLSEITAECLFIKRDILILLYIEIKVVRIYHVKFLTVILKSRFCSHFQ